MRVYRVLRCVCTHVCLTSENVTVESITTQLKPHRVTEFTGIFRCALLGLLVKGRCDYTCCTDMYYKLKRLTLPPVQSLHHGQQCMQCITD